MDTHGRQYQQHIMYEVERRRRQLVNLSVTLAPQPRTAIFEDPVTLLSQGGVPKHLYPQKICFGKVLAFT